MDEVVHVTSASLTARDGLRDRRVEYSLSHLLPAYLGLDPVKIQEMRMLMFPQEEEDEMVEDEILSDRRLLGREYVRGDSPNTSGKSSMWISHMQDSGQKTRSRIAQSPLRKTPIALLEYNASGSEESPSKGIVMTGQNKGVPIRAKKVEGFKLEEKHSIPVSGKGHSHNLVDAALFMGRSFRAGWGPNGVLVHSGTPVGNVGTGLLSLIHIEKVVMDQTVRNQKCKVKEELIDLSFSSPLNLHKSLDRETIDTDSGTFKLNLQKVVCSRAVLSDVCQAYIGILEKQLEISTLATSSRVLLMHQATIWELIRVLFLEREARENSKPV